MNEATRLEIVQRHQQGASIRAIAGELGVSRGAVGRVLDQVQAQREGRATPEPRPRRRSILDESLLNNPVVIGLYETRF